MGISYVEFEDEAGVLRRYRKHVNGRGLVATTAKVDPTAFVDPTAYVDPGAEVQRGAQIGPVDGSTATPSSRSVPWWA